MRIINYLSNSPFKLGIVATLVLQVLLVSGFYLLETTKPALDVEVSKSIEVSKFVALSPKEEEEALKDLGIKSDLVEDSNSDDLVLEEKNAKIEVLTLGEKLKASPVVPKVITHKLKSGDTLASIWYKYTGSSKGATLAAKAFKEKNISLNSLKIGDVVELQISEEEDITALKKSLNEVKSILITGDSTKGYKGRLTEINIVEKDEQKTMFINNSIAQSATTNGMSYAVIDEIVDIFSHKINFRRDIHPGDSFTVMYTKRESEEGKSLTPGPVKAASIKSSGKTYIAVRHVTDSGNTYYYDKDGKPIGSYFLRYPLKFSRISSVFNRNRFHPVLKRRRPHNGVDFAAPTGTPVRSIGPGVVQIAGWKGGGGRTIKIKHNSRYSTAYLHLSKISKGLKVGSKVKKGQVIGKVGMSGLATGPHLHFSLYDRGKYVDPLKAKLPVIQNDKETIPLEFLKKQIKLLNFAHEKLHIALNQKKQDQEEMKG